MTRSGASPNTRAISMEWKPVGQNGSVLLAVRFPDGSTFTDRFDVTKAEKRAAFVQSLCDERPGISRKSVEEHLEKIASQIATGSESEGLVGQDSKRSQADLLVELTESSEPFRTPGGHDADAYITVSADDHKETWPVGSAGFRYWILGQYYKTHKKVPSSQAYQNAINVIQARALHAGPVHEVFIRVARHEGSIFIDLADDLWRALRIDPTGWSLVQDPPVKFARKRGMLQLPVPERGGSIDELRPFVNVGTEDNWRLLVAFLLGAFRPGFPFPILIVNGEQGSAKSTLCKIVKALIDPNKAPLRRLPKTEHDLMIGATNGWLMGFDNLSGLPPSLSDAICSLATGGGFATRELYTDDDEKILEAMRPVMLNGIDDLTTRSDLLDRAIHLVLPRISDKDRQTEEEMWNNFEECRPRILGALLDAVSTALANYDGVNLAEKPRMADFARWVQSAEPALGWPRGAFLQAYTSNVGRLDEEAIETSSIGPTIQKLIDEKSLWEGTASELLDELNLLHEGDQIKSRPDWPKSHRILARALRRLAPNFGRLGVEVEFGIREGGTGRRLIRIRQSSGRIVTNVTGAQKQLEFDDFTPADGAISSINRDSHEISDLGARGRDQCDVSDDLPGQNIEDKGNSSSRGYAG